MAWQYQPVAAGVSPYDLSRRAIRSMRISLPPLTEQTAIACCLDTASRLMRRAISATERQIALRHEHRTRLIADVVTGKLDVGEAAAKPPETNPLAGGRDRTDPIPTDWNLQPSEDDMAEEAVA